MTGEVDQTPLCRTYQLYPSMTSWWARATMLRPFRSLKAADTSAPNVYPAPRGEMPHPDRSSGSLHSKSHIGPSCGTSCTRSN